MLIGCCPHDIPILTRAGLIKTLGSPAPNSVKYFSSSELENKIADGNWSARVTNALYRYWQEKRKESKT